MSVRMRVIEYQWQSCELRRESGRNNEECGLRNRGRWEGNERFLLEPLDEGIECF